MLGNILLYGWKTLNGKTMAYNNNKEHKKIIDCVLMRNAIMYTNLGTDCPRSEYDKAKLEERRRLRKIQHLDPDKIGRLIKDSLDD